MIYVTFKTFVNRPKGHCKNKLLLISIGQLFLDWFICDKKLISKLQEIMFVKFQLSGMSTFITITHSSSRPLKATEKWNCSNLSQFCQSAELSVVSYLYF